MKRPYIFDCSPCNPAYTDCNCACLLQNASFHCCRSKESSGHYA